MSAKLELQQLALRVNETLSVYIAVHDRIFTESGTLKSVFKNLIGRATPMSVLLEDAENLSPILQSMVRQLEAFQQSRRSGLSQPEQTYLDLLSTFTGALQRTVSALIERQRLLNQGSKGGGKNSMSWNNLNDCEKTYRTAIREYQRIGQELNAASYVVFS